MNTITSSIENIFNLSPPLFVALLLFVINFVLRRIPVVPNKWIPAICIAAGAVLFPVFVPKVPNFQAPLARLVGTGFILGVAAWAGYFAIVAFAESKWPWLHGVINGPDAVKTPPPEPPAK